ncbi:hypothetical protein [Novosphingobium aerophilum]|uniref:hypothetical protein n=1 Tax=Novosphingobium aerophilum TaxID=2839843 RepID=UPI003FCFA29D
MSVNWPSSTRAARSLNGYGLKALDETCPTLGGKLGKVLLPPPYGGQIGGSGQTKQIPIRLTEALNKNDYGR